MTGADGQRGRSLHWLQALVLLVLLAGAGLPAPVREAGADPVIEAVLDRVATRSRTALGGDEGTAVAAAPPRLAPLPRPQPRTRSVHERGLPPARAP